MGIFGKNPDNKAQKLIESGLIELMNCQEPTRRADIIFVHGLGGDLRETWKHSEQEDFWPTWLGEDLASANLACGIWLFGYNSKKFFLEPGHTDSRYDNARLLLSYLYAKRLGNRPIFFISHSLGGLVVKEMLKAAQTNSITLLQQTKGVVFIATPHVGSDLATLVNIISTVSLNLFKETVSVEELQAHNAGLRELDEWYRSNIPALDIKTLPFYEMNNTWGMRVVDPDSANPKTNKQEFCTPIPADHITIAKCETRNALLYETVKNFLEDNLNP